MLDQPGSAATVFLADRMRRADYRGPFEILIRRVTYRATLAPDRA